jgi:HEAT repeat protein
MLWLLARVRLCLYLAALKAYHLLVLLHHAVAATAAPFGATARSPLRRHLVFFSVYGGIYLLALLVPPAAAVFVLALGLWGVLAINRAWAENEDVRSRIAKKIDDADPDDLPDLRLTGILASLQLLLLLPMLFQGLNEWLHLFRADEHTPLWTWCWFIVDKTYLKSLPDVMDLYLLHITSVDFASQLGRHLVMVSRLLFYYLMIQYLFRLWRIHLEIGAAITAVPRDPDLAVRLGRRAVPRLLLRLHAPDATEAEKANILDALGRIGAPAAFDTLRAVAQDRTQPEVLRGQAAVALSRLGLPEACAVLTGLLHSHRPEVRKQAAVALGQFPGSGAREALLERLGQFRRREKPVPEPDADVRGRLVEALGEQLGRPPRDETAVRKALDLILTPSPNLLEDPYRRVRNRTAAALARIGDPRGLRPLADLLATPSDPKLVQAGAAALGRLAAQVPPDAPDRSRAVDALLRVLERSDNASIRTAVVTALAAFRDGRAVPVLVEALRLALREGQPTLAEAIVKGLSSFGPEHGKRGRRLVRRHRLRRSRRRLARVLNTSLPLAERCRAAA